ncbi:MAG: helix-turn-helix domain-containing protein [Aphanocapsa lilacina HA4352-LM1]|jgi:IS30 family transposase|nr:helix-turn-helix domain-containing protein [Aphanocapsa lilacina HA4352-LM1]MBW4699768.1 helix-turn-helix domain-containing protein [Aphanocapsa lilacina HA4352-LM1]
MSYTQLSAQERQQIYACRSQQGLSLQAIAGLPGRNAGTISRELKRNRSQGLVRNLASTRS